MQNVRHAAAGYDTNALFLFAYPIICIHQEGCTRQLGQYLSSQGTSRENPCTWLASTIIIRDRF